MQNVNRKMLNIETIPTSVNYKLIHKTKPFMELISRYKEVEIIKTTTVEFRERSSSFNIENQKKRGSKYKEEVECQKQKRLR